MIERETITLHHEFGTRLSRVLERLDDEAIPLRVYESWRSALRQERLYALGRRVVGPKATPERPMGGKVTWSAGWHSFHQYGLAVDLVFRIGGVWTWEEQKRGQWARMHSIAKEEGLTPLYNLKGELIETAHIQLAGVSIEDLLRGEYPEGGGEGWEDALETLIHEWEQNRMGAPPVPTRRPLVIGETA